MKRLLRQTSPYSVCFMKVLQIKLSSGADVKKFESIVQNYPHDVYLRDDSYAVDAKSVLGLFSLDLSKPLNVEIHANECDQLLEELSVFCI